VTATPVRDFPKQRPGWKYVIIKPRTLATQWALPIQLWKDRNTVDIFFTPGHYAPRFCPVPYVSSIMDLAFVHFPNQFRIKDLYQLKYWTRYSVKKARHVITISNFSKSDIS